MNTGSSFAIEKDEQLSHHSVLGVNHYIVLNIISSYKDKLFEQSRSIQRIYYRGYDIPAALGLTTLR